MVTNEMRRGWLNHALDHGDSHLSVPVRDYEEVLDLLDDLEDLRAPLWMRGLVAFWWIFMALAIGYGALRTICAPR